MTSKGHALARDELIRVLTAHSGITTADGAVDGTTLIDANLIGKDSQKIVEKTILIMSGDADWEDKGASAFDTGTGKITLQGTGFSAQIKAGTIYRILNISSIEVDVANIEASVRLITKRLRDTFYVDGINGLDTNPGDATHPFKTIGAADAAAGAGDRIHVCQGTYDEQVNLTSAGVELECEPGTILRNTTPGTVLVIGGTNIVVKNLVVNQAGQIGVDINAANFKGENIRARSASIGFDMGAANPRLIGCYSEEHSVTGFNITESHGYYEDCIAVGSGATRGWYLSHTDAEKNVFVRCHSTGNTLAGWHIVVGADDNIFCLCTEGINDGAKVDAGNNVWIGRVRCTLPPFWSEFLEEVQLGDGVAGATVALPNVIVAGIPAGATVVRAVAKGLCRIVENINAAANKLNGATVAATSQVIQVRNSVGGTWTDAINFVDDLFGIAAGPLREGGTFFGGQVDVSGEVDGNGTYEFRWLLGRADLDFLNFNDVQVALEICYEL